MIKKIKEILHKAQANKIKIEEIIYHKASSITHGPIGHHREGSRLVRLIKKEI